MFALMRIKRKLVCKPPEVDNSRRTNQPSVAGWEIRRNDCRVGSQHGSRSSGVNLDIAGNNDTVGLTIPSNRRMPGVDLSILMDGVDNTDISGEYYSIGLDISPKSQRVRQLNSVLSDGLSLHVSRMLADNGELQSSFASIGYINRFSTTRRQHDDATPLSAHGGTSSNQQSHRRSRQSVVPASTHSTHDVPNVNVQSHSRHEFTVGSNSSNARPRVSGLPAEYKDIGGTMQEAYVPVIIVVAKEGRMKSLGAQIDESINNGHGPYVFKISGQLYHWIGLMCPAKGAPPRFLQLYIYDTGNEVDNRMSHFGGDDSEFRRDIVEWLIDLLDAHNALVQLFRTAREKFQDAHIPNFKARLYNVIGAREYELPTGDMLGAIVYEIGSISDMDYDIVLEERPGYSQRVNKLHPLYMSLHFPLLFIYGEDGYSKELKMIDVTGSSSEQKRVSMKAYYSYYLHDRANRYNYLSRTGRLFQHYVTAFCAIEQNRMDYIREHQNDIRN
nr:helitron helicase-like domain-containing protein [Tanacetum cinerariifolium]